MEQTKKKGRESENWRINDHFYSAVLREERARQEESVLIHRQIRIT